MQKCLYLFFDSEGILTDKFDIPVGVDNGVIGNAVAGGHATRVRRRPRAYVAPRAAPARACRTLHTLSAGYTRGRAPPRTGSYIVTYFPSRMDR